MESRTLLTSITIPGLGSINLGGLNLGSLNLGSITNGFTLNSGLSTFTQPTLANEWWLQNTGQTQSSNPEGPAVGTPGADVNAINAWNITTGSKNVVIAVLDTGIDLNNADLAGALWTNPGNIPGDTLTGDTHGWNFLDNNSDIQDNFVHGTAVADAIHSVAPNVSILPLVVGTATGADPTAIVNAINYLINLKKHGVDVVAINASYISTDGLSSAELTAISNAGSAGMLYSAAAGNAGINFNSLVPSIPSILQKYVNISSFLPSNLVFVAATNNQDQLASFSDYGSDFVSVGAPGVDMDLAIPGGLYVPLSGTSFSAPMVSAIAGLLASKVPTATMAQIKTAILDSGDLDSSLEGKTITGRRVDAYNALEYLMGQQLPTGVATITSNVISGWAFDANLGAAPASVEISVDGVMAAPIQANTDSSTQDAKLGSADHGFSIDVSSLDLAYGSHAIKVYALDNSTGKTTLIGSGTVVMNDPPTGLLESTDNNTIIGWAQDSDTPAKSIAVRVYLDGKPWLVTTANIARPDLTGSLGSANHGFSLKLPIPAGIHKMDIYAVDSLSGALTLIGTTELSNNILVKGAVENLTATTITGWAFDGNAGAYAAQISYSIDGGPPVIVTANLLRKDLTSTLGSASHGFNIKLPQLTAGDHTITVDAIDYNTKQIVNLATDTITVADPAGQILPTGTVDTLNNTTVAGTVTDPDSTAPIKVRIDIDGVAGKPFLATAVDSSTTYAYSYKLPKLTVAPHRIDVYAIDQNTGVAVLISRQLINYTPVTGNVDSITSLAAIGYALNPNIASKEAQVRIDVDGLAGVPTLAALRRTDLTATTGATNIGFNLKLPIDSSGTHHVTITVIDPTTLIPVIIFDGDILYA